MNARHPLRLFLASALLCIPAAAADQSAAGESAKAQDIAALWQATPPRLWHGAEQCRSLIDGLAGASAEVAFIEPLVRTDDANHPALARYQACAKKSYVGITESDHHRLRLYRNGPEEYLYSEWKDWSNAATGLDGLRHPDGYRAIDLERCSQRDLVPVMDGVRRGSMNHNAMLRFQSNVYVLDLGYSGDGKRYSFAVWRYDPEKRLFAIACGGASYPQPRRHLPFPHVF